MVVVDVVVAAAGDSYLYWWTRMKRVIQFGGLKWRNLVSLLFLVRVSSSSVVKKEILVVVLD